MRIPWLVRAATSTRHLLSQKRDLCASSAPLGHPSGICSECAWWCESSRALPQLREFAVLRWSSLDVPSRAVGMPEQSARPCLGCWWWRGVQPPREWAKLWGGRGNGELAWRCGQGLTLLSAASLRHGRGLSPCVLMAKHTGSELRREESCSSKARYWHKHKRISTGRD